MNTVIWVTFDIQNLYSHFLFIKLFNQMFTYKHVGSGAEVSGYIE